MLAVLLMVPGVAANARALGPDAKELNRRERRGVHRRAAMIRARARPCGVISLESLELKLYLCTVFGDNYH